MDEQYTAKWLYLWRHLGLLWNFLPFTGNINETSIYNKLTNRLVNSQYNTIFTEYDQDTAHNFSLRIKRRPEARGHQKLSRASKFSFRASKFFFFFMFKNL